MGEVLGVADCTKSVLRYITTVSHKTEWNKQVDNYNKLKHYLEPGTKIITKFHDNRKK